jgi:hypothetical protein
MSRIKHNPKSRLLYRKYVKEGRFNPYDPSSELREELRAWKLPSSNYIKKEFRGTSLWLMGYDTASYVAFEAIMGKPEIRLLACMRYYIELAKDEEVTRQDLFDEITNIKECGFIPKIDAKYLAGLLGVEYEMGRN